MNIFDLMALILMVNKGSRMFFDSEFEEYAIVFKNIKKISIPVECELIGNHIKTADKFVCRVYRE